MSWRRTGSKHLYAVVETLGNVKMGGHGPDTMVAYECGGLARCMLISYFLGCLLWQGMDEPLRFHQLCDRNLAPGEAVRAAWAERWPLGRLGSDCGPSDILEWGWPARLSWPAPPTPLPVHMVIPKGDLHRNAVLTPLLSCPALPDNINITGARNKLSLLLFMDLIKDCTVRRSGLWQLVQDPFLTISNNLAVFLGCDVRPKSLLSPLSILISEVGITITASQSCCED